MPTNRDTLCICNDQQCTIPYGYCHCGCGGRTSIWGQNHTKLGGVKGKPRKFIGKHLYNLKPPVQDAVPFKIDGVYCRLIQLSQGLHAIVWESDYKWLTRWWWSASYYRNTKSYYALRKEDGRPNGKTITMHRLILGLGHGDKRIADHENGNSLDNRRSNLRIVNKVQSSQNRGVRKDNKTGFTGVYFRKSTGKYAAQIRANKRTFSLGERDTPEEASALYCAAAEKYHGDFRRSKLAVN